MIPFFVFFMLCPAAGKYRFVIALILFIAASITDSLDGHIARKYNLITDFGKFMDPLADKMLVVSAMICLVSLGRIPAWVVIIIVAREFTISGFRLIAADKGELLGQVQNGLPDDHGHPDDRGYSGTFCPHADCNVGCTCTHSHLTDRLYL